MTTQHITPEQACELEKVHGLNSALLCNAAIQHYIDSQPALTPDTGEAANLWCEICEGTGEVYEEAQIGVTGSGGAHKCPDCDGPGYIKSSVYRTHPAPSTSQPAAKQPLTTEREELIAKYRGIANAAKLRGATFTPFVSADELLELTDMLAADARPKLNLDREPSLRADLAQWERLCDPAILHANLLRGLPAQLTKEQLLHLLGTDAPAQQVAIPLESSQEAADAIQAMLKEYQYPANPTNAARAGWRAARLYSAAQQAEQSTCDAGAVCLDCRPRNADGSCPDGKPVPQGELVKFLANGTRFKISYDSRQQTGKIHGIPAELGGRWVAFVAAENDCHMKLQAQPQRQPLTNDELDAVMEKMTKYQNFYNVARAIEFAHGIKGATE